MLSGFVWPDTMSLQGNKCLSRNVIQNDIISEKAMWLKRIRRSEGFAYCAITYIYFNNTFVCAKWV